MNRREMLCTFPVIASSQGSIPANDKKVELKDDTKKPDKPVGPKPVILVPCSGDTVSSPIQVCGTLGECTTGVTVILQQADGTPLGGGPAAIDGQFWNINIELNITPLPLEGIRVIAFCTGYPANAVSVSGIRLSGPDFTPGGALRGAKVIDNKITEIVRKDKKTEIKISFGYAKGQEYTSSSLLFWSIKDPKNYKTITSDYNKKGTPNTNIEFVFTTDVDMPPVNDIILAKAVFLNVIKVGEQYQLQSHTKHFIFKTTD